MVEADSAVFSAAPLPLQSSTRRTPRSRTSNSQSRSRTNPSGAATPPTGPEQELRIQACRALEISFLQRQLSNRWSDQYRSDFRGPAVAVLGLHGGEEADKQASALRCLSLPPRRVFGDFALLAESLAVRKVLMFGRRQTGTVGVCLRTKQDIPVQVEKVCPSPIDRLVTGSGERNGARDSLIA